MSIASDILLPNGLRLKNRLVKAALTEGLANKDNNASPELINLYAEYARSSGCGLLITGNILVDRKYLERPRNLVIDPVFQEKSEEELKLLTDLANAAKVNDTKIICQLNHVGRYAINSISDTCIAPSPITKVARFQKFVQAREISIEEIEDVIDRFVFAARKCEEAGFDGVQIHYAYGFLLPAFLSLKTNKRTDDYGCSLENRLRIIFSIVTKIKEAVSDTFLLSIKLDTVDLSEGELDVDEIIDFAISLGQAGVQLFEITGGNYERQVLQPKDNKGIHLSTAKREKFNFEVVTRLRTAFYENNLEAVVLLTGHFRSRSIMNRAIDSHTDLIGIGQPLCVDITCTNKLLDNTIDTLPDPSSHWKLPWVLSWNFFSKRYWNYRLRKKCIELTLYQNLIDFGNKKFREQNNTRYPNILLTARRIINLEKKQAPEIKLQLK